MLESLKGLFARAARGDDGVAAWAKQRGHSWKRDKDGVGFVVDGDLAKTPWRLEWGAPQRAYVEGRELRLRLALGLPADLQMLVMTKSLCEALERQAAAAGQGDQTPPGAAVLDEARWLALFPKIELGAARSLRGAFAGVSSLPHEGPAWLDGALGAALERSAATWLAAQPPFLLMTLRGRMYLRLQLASADPGVVAAATELFETAAAAALRVARARREEPVAWPPTGPTAWQSLPRDRDR